MRNQVSSEHYEFNKYVNKSRWNSYYNQIHEVMASNGESVLIIGPGDNIVVDLLKKFGKRVTTFDFAPDLKPDIIGDVTKIDDIINEKYDIVLCCQVLEHIPFNRFEETIKRISLVTRKRLILSLPYNSTYIKFNLRILGFRECCFIKRINIFWHRKFRFQFEGNNEHYWEIGIPKISDKKISTILNRYFNLKNQYFDSENLFHQFFICNFCDKKK